MTPHALAILTLVQSGIALAPDIIRYAADVKNFIAAMFANSVISAQDQNALDARITELCVARLRGDVPPHWRVESDPTPDSPQSPV